jgi:heme o synthase
MNSEFLGTAQDEQTQAAPGHPERFGSPSSADPRPGILRVGITLTKFWIALLSTLSAATGYLVCSRKLDVGAFTCASGVLVTAMGASAMNQFQDRIIDACMQRTRNRPVPAGIVSPSATFIVALLLIMAGLAVLYVEHNLAAASIALVAVVWYNFVYTYLKRISAFAAVPGAIIGSLPAVIGWAAAGGNPISAHVLGLAFFFFIWQVPHFWLLLFTYGLDYERAGLPSLTALFSTRQLVRLTGIWMLATGASSLLLPMFYLVASPWIFGGLVIAGIWLTWEAWKLLLKTDHQGPFHPIFWRINLYALIVMALLVVDALI